MANIREFKLVGRISIKASITKEANEALLILEKKIGLKKSFAVRAALDEYLKKHYPELYQTSDAELKMQARENILLKRFEREYVDKSHTEEWLPIYERSEQKVAKKMNKVYEEIQTVIQKIRKHDYRNKKELEGLEEQLDQLSDKLFQTKSELIDTHFSVQDLRRTKARIKS